MDLREQYDKLTEDIQRKVTDAQHDGILFSTYIKEQQNAIELEEKGRVEGHKEGLKEGRKEGLKEGRAESIRQLIRKGLEMSYIIDLFDMSKDEANQYFGDIAGNAAT